MGMFEQKRRECGQKLIQVKPIHSCALDIFGRWKHVPANQRGRPSALRGIFMGHT